MSRHDAISCDACMKSSFSGNRYKCLICYDYDLCASCYEAGATSVQHLAQHPMQCILARSDYELYYSGEEPGRAHLPRSFTCPFCCRMGFSDISLSTHVNSEHSDDSFDVVCPVCAATPGGDSNHVTDDFIAHLMLEHRGMAAATEHAEQQTLPLAQSGMSGLGRLHREAHHSPSSTISSLSPSGGHDSEPIDSMSELLYHLTTIRNRGSTIQSISSQLQQLELQLQSTRHHLEGLPIRHSQQVTSRLQQQQQRLGENPKIMVLAQTTSANTQSQASESMSKTNKQYLLSRLDSEQLSEFEQENAEVDRADKAVFVQELLLTALVEDTTSKVDFVKSGTASTSEPAVQKCDPPVLSSGNQMKNVCERKPVSMTHKEVVTKEISSAFGGNVSHQNLDKMEHPQKNRPHFSSQKILKNRSSK